MTVELNIPLGFFLFDTSILVTPICYFFPLPQVSLGDEATHSPSTQLSTVHGLPIVIILSTNGILTSEIYSLNTIITNTRLMNTLGIGCALLFVI